MAYAVTVFLAILFFALQRDRLKEPELVVPALIGFPILFFGIRTFLAYFFTPKPALIDKVIDRAMEDEEEKPEGDLPKATYKNWKDDLEKVVENHMDLDDFLSRWRGRGPDRKMKDLEAPVEPPQDAAAEKKNRLREMLTDARRKLGEIGH